MAKKKKFVKKIKKRVKKEAVEHLIWWQKLSLLVISLLALWGLVSVSNIFLADISFNLGESASSYGLYETAVDNYQEAIRLNPREPRYHRELANALARLGRVKEATQAAEMAYRLNPRNSLTLRAIITTYQILAKTDNRYQKRAEELIAEAIRQQPTNPELYFEQAKIFLEATKSAKAKRSLEEALTLKPDYQQARELLETFR